MRYREHTGSQTEDAMTQRQHLVTITAWLPRLGLYGKKHNRLTNFGSGWNSFFERHVARFAHQDPDDPDSITRRKDPNTQIEAYYRIFYDNRSAVFSPADYQSRCDDPATKTRTVACSKPLPSALDQSNRTIGSVRFAGDPSPRGGARWNSVSSDRVAPEKYTFDPPLHRTPDKRRVVVALVERCRLNLPLPIV